MYGEATRNRGLQAHCKSKRRKRLTETMRGRESVEYPAQAAKNKIFWGSAPNPAETQPPSGAGPRTPSGHQYFVRKFHTPTPPRKTVLRTRGRYIPLSHSKHDEITPLLSMLGPLLKAPVIIPSTPCCGQPRNYCSLRRIRDESNHSAPAGADDVPTRGLLFQEMSSVPKTDFLLCAGANNAWARVKIQGACMMDHFKVV